MRVMVLVKATEKTEAGVMPTEAFMTAMGNFNQELADAGVLLGMEGLHPTAKGKRVRFARGKSHVIDGPFAETKELLGGYWLWEVKSLEDAVAWIKRSPFEDGEIEIRPVFEAADFGAEFTPDLRDQEERIRAGVAKKS